MTAVIYLDYNASTPVLTEVRDAMLACLGTDWGNPSSSYRFGVAAKNAIERSREQVARLTNASVDAVVFTSGATEANNTAIHSAVFAACNRCHVIATETEHSSVLNYLKILREQGTQVTLLSVDRNGCVDPTELQAAIRPETALVSIMWANNETGVILPIHEYGAICRRARVPFHCDAVQAVGKIPVDFAQANCDYLTISGHKLGAAKGIGAIIVGERAPFHPLIIGGKQENGMRGGTEPVASIVGFGVACAAASQRSSNAWSAVGALRDQFESRILSQIPGAYRNGLQGARLPNTLNFGIHGVDSDALVTFLDRHDVCVSSGSACMEQSLSPSHVISAMTRDHTRAGEALRVSLGLTTTSNELDRCFQLIQELVNTLR